MNPIAVSSDGFVKVYFIYDQEITEKVYFRFLNGKMQKRKIQYVDEPYFVINESTVYDFTEIIRL